MALEAETGHVALSKRRLLEYLEDQKAPVTAKVVSIDLDTRASTATEMLERCAAQGLVEREANRRPRDYRITEEGRKRLKSWSTADPEELASDPRAPGEPVSVSEVRDELDRQMDKLREEMATSDLFELRNLPRMSATRLQARAEQFKCKLESLAEESRQRVETGAIVALYQAHSELHLLAWFDSEHEVKGRIAVLEGAIEAKTADTVLRLVRLEREAASDLDDLRTILELREALHLPASIFGPKRETSEAESALRSSGG